MNHAHRNFRRIVPVPGIRQRHRTPNKHALRPKRSFGRGTNVWRVQGRMLVEAGVPGCTLKKTAIPKERPLYCMIASTAEKRKPQLVKIGYVFLAAAFSGLLIGGAYVLHKKMEERVRAMEQKMDALEKEINEMNGELESRMRGVEAKVDGDLDRIVKDFWGLEEGLRRMEKEMYGEEWVPPIILCPEGEECK